MQIDCFPKWNPQASTNKKFGSRDFRVRYNALRNASSAFIKRKDVRELILEKCNYKCVICGETEGLQIDHTVSVYQCAMGNHPITELNTFDNLQVLCFQCNFGKAP